MPTFQEASAAAACLEPWRLGPEGRVPPLREVPALPTLFLSSRSVWDSSRLVRSALPWRATAAAPVLLDVVADLPRLERASRRARTRARLGLCWAARLAVTLRLVAAESLRPLAKESLRLGADRLANLAEPLQSQSCLTDAELLTAAIGAAEAGATTSVAVRVRSLEVSARLPRLERASRRAKTRSRLGLTIGRAALWERPLEGAVKLRLAGDCVAGAVGAGVAEALADAAGAAPVRVGRASTTVRTRL